MLLGGVCLVGEDKGVDLVVEDFKQFWKRNGAINKEAELGISFRDPILIMEPTL